MAGRGREGRDEAQAGGIVSERSLFAASSVSVQPFPLIEPSNFPPGSLEAGSQAQPATLKKAPARAPEILARVMRSRQRFFARDFRTAVRAALETELDRGILALLVPVFLAAGVIIYFALDAEPSFMRPVAVALLMAVAALLSRNGQKTHLLFLAVLLCALGMVAGKVETWRAGTRMLGAEIATQVTGRVVAIDDMASGRKRLTLDVISTARPKLRYAPERVRLSARMIPAGIAAGALVTGYARLLPPSGPIRPDSYDFSFESYFSGIGASGFYMSNPRLLPEADKPFGARMSAAVENARETIADRIRASIGGAEGEIAAALIVGVRAGIPDAVNEAMRRTGIYHIISISGLHMALVAGTVMALLRGAFALFPDFSSRRPVKKYAAAAALFSIAAYLAISGVVVAAERSFIMLAVMLIAVLFDRAALTMRNLAISAVAVILISPHEVVGPSFQMSFAATAALVGAYAGWTDYRTARTVGGPPPKRSLPGFLAHKFVTGMGGLATTSIVAGSATALFGMWHFQSISPLSLFANLAVMPIVSVMVMPFAVLAALAMPFGADWPFLFVMGKGLTAMIAISQWISVRSPVDAVGLISIQSVLLVAVALVIATMATTWLRLAALPFAIAGLAVIGHVRTPDVLVSEDARLVAVPIGGGELAVNRPKPNEFTVDNWRRALDAETVVPPEAARTGGPPVDPAAIAGLPAGAPFLCSGKLCAASHTSGAIVALAGNEDAARPACGYATLIVIADATARDPCRDPLVLVITLRDLARRGSAAIFFDAQSATAAPLAEFALETLYRPWHEQRRFSREARGRAPYQKPDRSEQVTTDP